MKNSIHPPKFHTIKAPKMHSQSFEHSMNREFGSIHNVRGLHQSTKPAMSKPAKRPGKVPGVKGGYEVF